VLETESLFSQFRDRNNSLNIRGCLHKCKTCYFQIIEGESDVIDLLFEKIKADKKHKDIQIIVNMPIMEYTFKDFTIGYCKVNAYKNTILI